jgi:PAS domain S-box-containing protein
MHSPAHEDRLALMATSERILHRTLEILESTRQLAVLNAIAAAASHTRDCESLFREALDILLRRLSFEAGALYVSEAASELRLRYSQGIPHALMELLERVPVGEGPIGEAAALGEPIVLEVSAVEPSPYRHLIRRTGFRLFVLIPLRAGEQTVGVLLLARQRASPAHTPDVREPQDEGARATASGMAEHRPAFLSALGHLLGTALENARRYQQMRAGVERERRRGELWHRAAHLMSALGAHLLPAVAHAPASESLAEMFAEACRLIQEEFDIPNVSIFLLDESAQELILIATRSRYAHPAPLGYRQSLYVGLLGWAARHGETLLANDVSTEPRFVRYHAETHAELDLPMRCEGRVVGVLNLESDRPHAFTEDDVAALRLIADHLSVMLETTRYAEKLRQHLQRTRESEHSHRAVIESLPEGVLIVQDRIIRSANSSAAVLFGSPLGEWLLGSDFLSLVREDDRDLARALLESSESPARGPDVELRLLRRDGGEVSVRARSAPVAYDGRPAICILLREESSERSLAERRLQAEKLAALEQFVSGVAHELNNPLTSVLGYAELVLAHESLSESARRDLRTIVEQAQRAKKIVQNLLAFARFYRPEKSAMDVNAAIRAALETHRARIPSSVLRVTLHLAPDLPRIWADRNLLEQVFQNIILNAEQAVRQARGHGTLRIETCRKRSSGKSPSGEVIEIRFTDDGPGIPASHLPRIFDPFFTTKSPGEGTGLGLSICYGIIKEHGGEIYALSQEGHGATFVIELPLIPASGSKNPAAVDAAPSHR